MWTVVYIAKNREVYEHLLHTLDSNGLLTKTNVLGTDENKNTSYEILVPESEVEKAHTLIIDLDF